MGRAFQPDFETTSITIGCGVVVVVEGCVVVVVVVVVVVEVDVVDVAGTMVVVVVDGTAGAVDPGAAWVLGLSDRPNTNRAPIEETIATPNTDRVRINARR